MSTLKVGAIQSTTGNAAITVAANGNLTIPGTTTFSNGAGAMVKLLDTTSVAGATYDISSTYINATYDTYIIYGELLPATDNVYLYSQVFVGGTVQTGTIYGYETAAMSSSAYSNNDATTLLCQYAHGPMGNATGEGITFNATLQNVNSTTRPCSITGMSNIANTSGTPNSSTFAGQMIPANAANVVNGLRIHFSSGNIASGTIRLYGVR